MFRFSRRAAVAAFAALSLVGCGAADTSNAQGGTSDDAGLALTDMALGSDDASITIVEYASWTCPACLQFHNDVVPMLKSDYVETGQVKFVFREFPTPPANLSAAGFAIARCAGEDSYYNVIDDLFSAQTNVLNLARSGGDVEGALRQIASSYGITGDAFGECLANRDVIYAINDSIDKGESQGVNSTPTVFINGEKLQGFEWRSAEGMKALLDAKLSEETSAE